MEAARGEKIIDEICNKQFWDLIDSDKRYKVHQGGARSGKTYAICQYICYLLVNSEQKLTIDIVRKTLPALKSSVMRDMIYLLDKYDIYWKGIHNKAENTFEYNGHLISFISVDQPQKLRGRRRNIAFLNEANELDLEDLRQIAMRCSDPGTIIMDFNPSDPVHWIYDEIIPREDCDTWITTYKDNLYLDEEIKIEIERLRERDPDYFNVFGLGQRAHFSARQIFSNWKFIPFEEFPEFDKDSEAVIGLDFGFTNDPTAATLIFRKSDKIYLHEIFYTTGLTNSDIVDKLRGGGYDQTLIFYDAAEPKSGEEMKRAGLRVKPAVKGTGSINAGISLLREYDIIVSKESKNIFKEYNNYYWEQLKDGTIINKPIDKFNHAMDSIRYGVYSQYSKHNDFFVI